MREAISKRSTAVVTVDESSPLFRSLVTEIEARPPFAITQGEFATLRIDSRSKIRSLATFHLRTCVCLLFMAKNADGDYTIGISHFDSHTNLEENFKAYFDDFSSKIASGSRITAKMIGGQKGVFGSSTPLLLEDGNSEELITGIKSLLARELKAGRLTEILSHDHYSRKGPCGIPLPRTGHDKYDVVVSVEDDSVRCVVNQSNGANILSSAIIKGFTGAPDFIERHEASKARAELCVDDKSYPPLVRITPGITPIQAKGLQNQNSKSK